MSSISGFQMIRLMNSWALVRRGAPRLQVLCRTGRNRSQGVFDRLGATLMVEGLGTTML